MERHILMEDSTGRKLIVCVAVLSAFCSAAAFSRDSELQRGPYQTVTSVPGGGADGVWDYATVDDAARRLYLAQDGVTVVDLDTGKVTPHFVSGKAFQGLVPTHHVLPVNGGKALAVSDSITNSVDFFDPQTGKILSVVSVGPPPKQNWHNPDGLVYEPKSKLLIAVNGDSSSLSLIDTTALAKRGEIPIGKGKLETAAADGAGLVYVNQEESNSIAVVDVGKRKVVQDIALRDCEEPTGLAYDSKDRLVISVCSNGLVKFIAADDAKEVASVKVGSGADGVVYDPERHFVFSFGGDAGTLSIIAVQDRMNIALVQTLKTRPGARLGALDPKTGRLYIPTARFGPPAAPITLPGLGTLPGLNPHTFEFLVVAPASRGSLDQ
jgi:DNA-binding beta-propeller fold protein YncE